VRVGSARPLLACLALVLGAVLGGILTAAPPVGSQGVDVLLNVVATGAKKLNIAIPDFTLVAGADTQGLTRKIPQVVGDDLRFSAIFSVVSGTPALPARDAEAVRKAWVDFAAAGAHAALHGLLSVRGDRAEVEVRLYDLTSPDLRVIASKKLDLGVAEVRRLAHKVADEVVFQFTGELGIADTKIAYVGASSGSKELYTVDYDGNEPNRLTADQSINLMPAWSPDARSLAFTSYMRGYPSLYRLFAFERRPVQLLAGFSGINTTPAWNPDGRTLAVTLSKDGSPDIYILTVATGAFRRLTTHPGIDTEPTWSPTGREIAFVSDRAGPAHVYVMDAEGANVRRISSAGFNTQPRWSPKGDILAYTSRQGGHDIWAVGPDGSNPRRLTAGPGRNQSASWAPNGRHLVFQSDRHGRFELFTMLTDGSEQQAVGRGLGEATSPAWSPRLP
jgi:TolB protein